MDPEKLERIQLPEPSAAEKTVYNHLLAERLIRIMNSAAQPGAWNKLAVHRGGGIRGIRPPHLILADPGRSQPLPLACTSVDLGLLSSSPTMVLLPDPVFLSPFLPFFGQFCQCL